MTGKYTRENGAKIQGLRGARAGELTDEQFDIMRCGEQGRRRVQHHFVRAVALAWLNALPGVQQTIIGAKTLVQLDENL